MADYREILARQAATSRGHFGPGERREGILAHISKEIEEYRESHGDPEEAVDILILAQDLLLRRLQAMRPDLALDEIAADAEFLVLRKLSKNEMREWPDWRGKSQDEPIEHVRGIHD